MQNTPTQNTITRFDFNDEISYALTKLEFMSDAIRHWNCNEIPLDENQLFGFGLISEDIIREIKELVNKLEE